jgi:hypothetical protein
MQQCCNSHSLPFVFIDFSNTQQLRAENIAAEIVKACSQLPIELSITHISPRGNK